MHAIPNETKNHHCARYPNAILKRNFVCKCQVFCNSFASGPYNIGVTIGKLQRRIFHVAVILSNTDNYQQNVIFRWLHRVGLRCRLSGARIFRLLV